MVGYVDINEVKREERSLLEKYQTDALDAGSRIAKALDRKLDPLYIVDPITAVILNARNLAQEVIYLQAGANPAPISDGTAAEDYDEAGVALDAIPAGNIVGIVIVAAGALGALTLGWALIQALIH